MTALADASSIIPAAAAVSWNGDARLTSFCISTDTVPRETIQKARVKREQEIIGRKQREKIDRMQEQPPTARGSECPSFTDIASTYS